MLVLNQPKSYFLMDQVLAHTYNTKNLRWDFQQFYNGTLDLFVLEPHQKSVHSNILVAMRRFKNVVRLKEFWHDQKNQPKMNDLKKKRILDLRLTV